MSLEYSCGIVPSDHFLLFILFLLKPHAFHLLLQICKTQQHLRAQLCSRSYEPSSGGLSPSSSSISHTSSSKITSLSGDPSSMILYATQTPRENHHVLGALQLERYLTLIIAHHLVCGKPLRENGYCGPVYCRLATCTHRASSTEIASSTADERKLGVSPTTLPEKIRRCRNEVYPRVLRKCKGIYARFVHLILLFPQLVRGKPVVVFMKGEPTAPMVRTKFAHWVYIYMA